jgi:hypothetical protein
MSAELLHILSNAKIEIEQLRKQREIQSAQLAIIDVFAAALGLRRNEGSMGIDVVWDIERKIKELSEPAKVINPNDYNLAQGPPPKRGQDA